MARPNPQMELDALAAELEAQNHRLEEATARVRGLADVELHVPQEALDALDAACALPSNPIATFAIRA